ncbi:MAG: hypothetical protein AABZ74_09200 [Cyanobacteriota bacterium]
MSINFSITFIITGEFNNFHRKPMIISIAKAIYPNIVIIIDRPYDFIPNFFRKRYKLFKEKIEKKDNVFILNSKIIIHDQITLRFCKNLKKISFFIIKKDFNNLYSKLEIKNNILWIMHPDLIDYSEYINHNSILYDCYDEFIVNTAVKNIEKREKELVEKSNIIITSSKYLKEKKEILYNFKNIFFSSTAINKENFCFEYNKNLLDIKKTNEIFKNKKIIGFAGSIRNDIDLEIVEYIAKEKNDCSIVFLGKIFDKKIFERLKLFDNIIFLGEKNFEDFIKYIDLFDVSIMPHILNDFILSSSPYKFYQYLAKSCFIVSSKIPEIVDFEKTELGQKFVRTAKDKFEFLSLINYFINKPKEKISEEELYSISWDNRFEKLKEKMIELKIID